MEEIYKLVPVGTPVEIRADEKPKRCSKPSRCSWCCWRLGFMAGCRIIHGSNPRSWAKELRERTGDEAAVPMWAATDTHSQHASLK
jgi:hypothetical protein